MGHSLTETEPERCEHASRSLLFAAEAAKEDSIAQGACALLRAQSLFRAVSRQPSALAGLVAGLMAGSRYNSPKAQQSILECYLLFALRFIRPPQLAQSQVRPVFLHWTEFCLMINITWFLQTWVPCQDCQHDAWLW